MNSWLEFVEYFKTRKLISTGQRVFSEGDLVSGIYIICSGKLKVTMKTDDSIDRIIRLAGEGQVLGHRGLNTNMTYPISAETLTSSELAFIPNEDFFKLLRNNADLSFFMMMFFADELQRSEQKYRLRTLKAVNEKVALSICMIIDAFGYKEDETCEIDSSMRLSDFSNFAEISTPSLRNVLKYFSRLNIINWLDNKICVINEPVLREIARAGNLSH